MLHIGQLNADTDKSEKRKDTNFSIQLVTLRNPPTVPLPASETNASKITDQFLVLRQVVDPGEVVVDVVLDGW